MKILSLNTWGGEAGLEKLLSFLKSHRNLDVFCLQEVWDGGAHMFQPNSTGLILSPKETKLFNEIKKALPHHRSYFRPNFMDFYGLALFVKKDLAICEEGEIFVHREKGFIHPKQMAKHGRNLHFVTLEQEGKKQTVINFHGLWHEEKSDTQERLEQSKKILQFIEQLDHPFVLCGDFNLRLESQSLQMLEDWGMRNLIKEYNIPTTRSRFYTKNEKHADYFLMHPALTVSDFKVLKEEVSDHLPLYAEISC